ncbi:hypothetical protein H6F74_13880 [Trichocoleus sp. FACHB-90]|uniref:hypothetical protein n=1 Tax=Cyanophyceae TaxID=3028117 RepID=UPI001688F968|nr:hypothetical protein [Trichocoleus sp. FACHB-90]MBD1927325.1 hypothetical protein [Trichocoleus sp. FACHB-90]
MLNLDSFVPNEMTIAPKHPLEANMDLPIPDGRSASKEEIRLIQRRDRIPGVIKRTLPLDAQIYWEYWWCIPDRVLLEEDLELLRSDRIRQETVLSKLVWLFGGYCFGDDSELHGEKDPVYDWQKVVEFACQHNYQSYVLDIDFLPTAIKLDNRHSDGCVAVEPGHWHIEFFRLQQTEADFEIQEPKNLCSCQIWTGKPFIKNLQTGETLTRYDLWISSPGNIISSTWLR